MNPIIYTLISWRWNFNVLPLFYLDHTNTIVLTLYISSNSLIFKKPRRNHLVKHVGMPEIRAPPHKKWLLKNFKEIYEMTKHYEILQIITDCFTDVLP